MQGTGIRCGYQARAGTLFCMIHEPKGKCEAIKKDGDKCGYSAVDGTNFCGLHRSEAPRAKPAETKPEPRPCKVKPMETKPEPRPCPLRTAKPEAQPRLRPPTTQPEVGSICQAMAVPFRCFLVRDGPSRFCTMHRPLWHQKDTPAWDLPPGTTLPDHNPTICLAPVAETGLRCCYQRCSASRWCAQHFREWHGKNTPAWRPCPA
ncbi:unnamed protein product [Ectocarpus fasciculatus]